MPSPSCYFLLLFLLADLLPVGWRRPSTKGDACFPLTPTDVPATATTATTASTRRVSTTSSTPSTTTTTTTTTTSTTTTTTTRCLSPPCFIEARFVGDAVLPALPLTIPCDTTLQVACSPSPNVRDSFVIIVPPQGPPGICLDAVTFNGLPALPEAFTLKCDFFGELTATLDLTAVGPEGRRCGNSNPASLANTVIRAEVIQCLNAFGVGCVAPPCNLNQDGDGLLRVPVGDPADPDYGMIAPRPLPNQIPCGTVLDVTCAPVDDDTNSVVIIGRLGLDVCQDATKSLLGLPAAPERLQLICTADGTYQAILMDSNGLNIAACGLSTMSMMDGQVVAPATSVTCNSVNGIG